MIPQLLLAGLLLGHAMVHGAFLTPRPPATPGGPPWPFEISNSTLLGALGLEVDGALVRLLGTALVAVTIGGFALAALAAVGVAPAAVWSAGVAAGAIASLGVLVLFFHPWLVLGVAIDIVLLWAALVARWMPGSLAP